MKDLFLPFFRSQHNLIPGCTENDVNITFVDRCDLPAAKNTINYVSGDMLKWVNELVRDYHKRYLKPTKMLTPDNLPVIQPGQVAYAICPMGASGAPRYVVHGNSEISFMRIEYKSHVG